MTLILALQILPNARLISKFYSPAFSGIMVPKILLGHSETIKWYRMSYLAYWTSNLLTFVVLELLRFEPLGLQSHWLLGFRLNHYQQSALKSPCCPNPIWISMQIPGKGEFILYSYEIKPFGQELVMSSKKTSPCIVLGASLDRPLISSP